MLNPIRALRGFWQRRARTTNRRVYPRTRLAMVESLENRRVLAVNTLPGIMGTVYADTNGNGIVDTGEGIQGAIVQLFQDDGDGIFEPGGDDIQIGVDLLTDENGEYCFDDLDQDQNYFVQQPEQSVGAVNLVQQVSALIESAPQLIIDSFETTQSTAAFPPPISSDASALAFPNADEVIGAERDLAVQLLAGASEVQLRVNPFGLDDVLIFDSSAGTVGTREVIWDVIDFDGDGLSLGLGGLDLTQGGTLSGLTMRTGVDANGANARFRIYQGSTSNFSEVTLTIPVTGGAATEWLFVPFTSFAGAVSASNVDAIQLILDTGSGSVDGQIDVIGVLGPKTADFENDVIIDLELDKSVDSTQVIPGDTVTWTLTLINNAENANAPATGVVVGDAIPSGLTLLTATSSNGTFSNGTWTLSDPVSPGDVETLTLVTTVNGGISGGTIIENIAQVTAQEQQDIDSLPNNDDGDQSEDDEDNAQITVESFIDLELTKVVDSAFASSGDQVTFTITLSNNGNNANTDATGVQVTDELPAGMTLVNATPSGNGTFANGVWSLVDPLSPGSTQTLSIVASVDNGVVGDSKLTNTAQVSAANEPDIDSSPNNDDGDQSEDDEGMAMLMVRSVIDLELDKSVNVVNVNAGDSVVWTISVTNNPANSNAAATNVQVADAIPTGVTLVSATPSGSGTFSNGVWSLVDPLARGSVATLTILTTVNNGLAGGTSIVNDAQVFAADQPDFDSTPNNDDGSHAEDDEDSASVQVSSRIDLELEKTVNASNVLPGDQVTWTVTITNNPVNANADATGVRVSDLLPSGVTFVNATPSVGTFTGDTWILASPLSPGGSESLTIVTTVDSNAVGTIENVAQVSAASETDVDSTPGNDDGDQSEDDEDNAIIQVSPLVIDLELEKTVSASNVFPGDQVTWTVTITNNPANANADATQVQVSDVLPDGVTFVSATPSVGSFNGSTWTLSEALAPGDSETLSILTSVDGDASGSIENVAQVSAASETDIDSTPGNDDGDQSEDDEDNAVIQVSPLLIDLELSKTVSATTVNNGDQVTWILTVTNNAANANSDATGVQITDVLPAGVTLQSASPSSGTFSGNTWTLGAPLAPGSSATLGIVTSIDNDVAGGETLINTAQVATANETDVDSSPGNDNGDQSEDDEDSAQITVTPVIDLEIEKSVNPSNASVGDTVTWTIVVQNNSTNANTAATGVTVKDTFPADVTFVSANTSNGTYNNATGVWTLAAPLNPGESATLTVVSTVEAGAASMSLLNVVEVATQNENDIDSQPGNDDGDQSEDDEDSAILNVGFIPPSVSKRNLLASS